MFSSAGAQPISLKSFRGLGHFPNKIARVYKHKHCLPSAFHSWQVMRSGHTLSFICLLFYSSCFPEAHIKYRSFQEMEAAV